MNKSPSRKPSAKSLLDMPLELFCKIWKNLDHVKLSYIEQLFTIKNKELQNKIIYCTINVNIDTNNKNLLSKLIHVQNIKMSHDGLLLIRDVLHNWSWDKYHQFSIEPSKIEFKLHNLAPHKLVHDLLNLLKSGTNDKIVIFLEKSYGIPVIEKINNKYKLSTDNMENLPYLNEKNRKNAILDKESIIQYLTRLEHNDDIDMIDFTSKKFEFTFYFR